MDTQKATEVKIEELTAAEVKDEKDAEKSKVEGTKEAKKKAEGKEKDIKEEETNVYSKLNSPTEDVYNISKPTSSSKRNEDVYRKLYLFKRISVFFMVFTLLLLAVVLALAIKYAPEKNLSYPGSPVYRCTRCDKDWIKINGSCYFPSMKRLNWYDSRKACQKEGGDLVVINSERLQRLLSRTKGPMYWIGLSYAETEWMWVNNTTLTQSYWAPQNPNLNLQGSCVLLQAERPYETNWHIRPCGDIRSHYMCQKG